MNHTLFSHYPWIKSISSNSFRAWLVILLLAFVVLSGCSQNSIYRDKFDSQPIGGLPAQPDIGSSTVSGDVLIAENPMNDISSDRWLQLKRVGGLDLAEYRATPSEPLSLGDRGSVEFSGYIPSFAPAQMTVVFETQDIEPQFALFHIDLLPNGDIRVSDNTVIGTYAFDSSISFSIDFDLSSSPPTATILVEGEAGDATLTVDIPGENIPGFGLGHVKFFTSFEGETSPSGQFLINQVVVNKATN
jgi:hypothetical protein